MVRYMEDSTDCTQFENPVNVPGTGWEPLSLRCGYINGIYAGDSQACGPVDVLVDVLATAPQADVLDIENGDATPQDAPGWVDSHNAGPHNYPAILYVNRSNITAVANALGSRVVGRDYCWWISTLDGTTSVPDMTGVTAVQAWGSGYFPTNIDLSVVYDDSWKDPQPITEDIMLDSAWEVDPTNGRAYASFEVGTGPGGNSQVVHNLWVACKSLYGDLSNVRVTFENDSAQAVAAAGGDAQTLPTLASNTRAYWQAPAGASDVTIEWDTTSTGKCSPYLVAN